MSYRAIAPLTVALMELTMAVHGGAYAAEPPMAELVTRHIDFSTECREFFYFVADGFKTDRLAVGEVVETIVKEAPVGCVMHVFATPSHAPVATIRIKEAKTLLRMQSREMQKPLSKLRPFFRTPPEDGELEIDVSRIPNTIATVRQTDYPAIVVACGDPIYHGGRFHRGFNMESAVVPDDSTLLNSSLSYLSPFYQGVKDFPPHTLFNILAHSSEWGADHQHRQAVERYYRLFAQEKGDAYLLRITADVDAAFNFENPELPAPVVAVEGEFGVRPAVVQSAQEPSGADPLVVFVGWPKDKPPVTQIDPPQGVESIFAKAMDSTTHTLIAIRWNIDNSNLTLTDVDLRLSHPDFADEMSYANPKMPFAKLVKDVRYGVTRTAKEDPASAFGENWEMVVVPNKYLPQVKAWINVFTAVGPIKVNVAQVGAGQRRDAYYTIPSRFGDEAQDRDHRETSRAWFPLTIPMEEESPQPEGAVSNWQGSTKQAERVPTPVGAVSGPVEIVPSSAHSVRSLQQHVVGTSSISTDKRPHETSIPVSTAKASTEAVTVRAPRSITAGHVMVPVVHTAHPGYLPPPAWHPTYGPCQWQPR
ncbi:hypothetical protein [Aeoliella sp.]|uniref:hypothetical protein n=1 Tax=Aeoliella sp. TaxID=2795800 RepID=UPI003CCBFEB3